MISGHKSGDELNHSRPLNVHRWSDYPEVNDFINQIHDRYFSDFSKIKKKHLKVVLLDLYVAWYEDPDLCLAVHLNKNKYRAGSRYSKLNISKLTIPVVFRLEELGFIYLKKGNYNIAVNRISRIWATDKLIKLFKSASFNVLDIHLPEGMETIILRDEDKNDIEYEDTNYTCSMRAVLTDYNDLLHRTHIDCSHLSRPFINKKKGKQKKAAKTYISQHRKHVRRIFNDGSWFRGGRFYGPFWQQIGKEHRQHIRINGERTIELDFSGWHIALLYARKNINYFETSGYANDPYDIHVPEVNDPEYCRWLIKTTLLIAVNAEDQEKTIHAVQHTETPENVDRPEGLVLSGKLLTSILDKLKAKHEPIADFFCSGAGIELQAVDAEVTNQLIQHFTSRQVPILTIHDSYVVPEIYNQDLWEQMLEAYRRVSRLSVDADDIFGIEAQGTAIKQIGYVDELESDDPEQHREILALKDAEPVSKGYLRRLSQFEEWSQKRS